MARVAPAPGTIVEETVRTRTLPDATQDKADERDFWEFQAYLQAIPKGWDKYLIYVYRMNGEKMGAYVAKYGSAISEDMIAENHGGGKYRCWLKTTSGEIIKRADFEIEGAPKINTGAPAVTPLGTSQPSSDQASIGRLCDLLERVVLRNDNTAVQGEALRSALQLQSEGFRSVVTNVRDIAPPAQPSNPMDDITRQFLQAAITKMLNPSDPIETFAKMMAAMKGLGFDAGAAKASVGAELVRTVGGAIPQIMEGVKSYTNAVSKQAELEILRITHGLARPPQQPPPPQPVAAQPPQAQAAIPSQPAPAQPAPQPMTFDDVERRIAAFMVDTQLTALQAANNILDFIEDISKDNLYPYICSLDEVNLTAFINSRPILGQVPHDPRFSEVVKKIVELTHSDSPSDSSSTSPQAPAAS